MISKALIRIKNQLKDIVQSPPIGWSVSTNSESQLKWTVWMDAQVIYFQNIFIQQCCPFYGEPIKVLVQFPQKYPLEKPIIKLAYPKRFFHANFRLSDGYICHKIIQSDDKIAIRQRIDCLRTFLTTPNYASPYNNNAGKHFLQKIAKMYQNDLQNDTRLWFKKAVKIFRGWQTQ